MNTSVSRRTRFTAMVVLVAASTLSLSACSVSTYRTVAASKVASVAADALEKKVGTRPEMDCGTSDVKLVNGTVVDCTLTDPGNGSEYDAKVTIEKVNGGNYSVDVVVADTAKN